MWPFDIFSTKKKYTLENEIVYKSPRYGKTITVPAGYKSDGATGVPDLSFTAYFVHDWICENGKWDDGTPITNWQASNVYSDILNSKGFYVRSHIRKIGTFLFGGEKLDGSIAGKVKDIF